MNIQLIETELSEVKADASVIFLKKDEIAACEHAGLLELAGFKGEQDTTCFFYEKGLLFCGVESKKSDDIRSAAAAAIKALKASNFKSAKIAIFNKSLIASLVEGISLGGYEFNDYKSEPKKTALEEIFLVSNDLDSTKVQESFAQSLIIANATNFTRDIVNKAPQEINPQTLSHVASNLAKENNLECTILQEEDLEKEKMGAMLAVGRASVHGSTLIHLAYKPQNPKKVVTLVGKGLTYDSGGLSLKQPTSMVTMKMDKAGACATLGIIKAVSELQLDIELHVFIGAVENMVGGNAYKPDDVLVSRSKTTIEVRNTDAEGRLVLADVLDYAQERVKADYIFDFATLTGACMIALGQYTTGIMGHSHKLKHDINKAASDAGEMTSSLPFNRHLKKLLKSDIADISNTASKPYGGAITAGMFLDKFIKEENKNKWMHFDIAGTAYTEAPWDCNVYGATGAGVRLMTQFLREL